MRCGCLAVADDIVNSLRSSAPWIQEIEQLVAGGVGAVADEIERHLETVARQMGAISRMAHLLADKDKQIERLRALCNDLHHDATCVESFCRLCGEGVQEWEARRG